jgi:hypothetical protein
LGNCGGDLTDQRDLITGGGNVTDTRDLIWRKYGVWDF